MTEYVIWGIPPNQNDETLLLAKVSGEFITDAQAAERYKNTLETQHGCRACRIQAIDGTLPDFAKAVQS